MNDLLIRMLRNTRNMQRLMALAEAEVLRTIDVNGSITDPEDIMDAVHICDMMEALFKEIDHV